MNVQNLTGDSGVGGVSPNGRLYSQNYPSIYSSEGAALHGGGQNGNREKGRERSILEAERERQRSGIVDLEEEGEEAEEEEEDMDERQPYGNESAGEESDHLSLRRFFRVLLVASCLSQSTSVLIERKCRVIMFWIQTTYRTNNGCKYLYKKRLRFSVVVAESDSNRY